MAGDMVSLKVYPDSEQEWKQWTRKPTEGY